MAHARDELGIVLGGGGARAAYQVGLLRFLARRFPKLRVPIITGVSAGAVNATHLANHRGPFAQKVETLTRHWCGLSVDQVFRVDASSLLGHMARGAAQLSFLGGRRHFQEMRGMVDTEPLREFLSRSLGTLDGSLPAIEENLEAGQLRALAITTTDYGSGYTVSFCQGREIQDWDRPQRRNVQTKLRIEHVMASTSLPLFFPAIEIDGSWFGDGGVRLHSPLAPATHLGASRILAVSTRHGRAMPSALEAARAYPPPAQIMGILYNSVFLDLLDQDAAQLERINSLLEQTESGPALGLRRIELLVLRPSQDLGALAQEYEPQLPRLFRFLTRRLGTRQAASPDFLSMLMFQGDYLERLIDLGEADAETRGDEIVAFVEAAQAAANPS